MPFLIVDNPFVVELRCPESQLVVGIWGGYDKTVRLQERFHQLVLVRGSLSKFKVARLDCARLAIVALRDIENDRVSMQLWRDIPIDRTGCIVLKLGGYKFASGLGRMIAADAGLCVAFELVEGNADALPVGFTDTLIAADEGRQRDGLGR